jgi:FAD/FMN-containing dehydrogenase
MSAFEEIAAALGPAGIVSDPADQAPYLTEWRNGRIGGRPGLVVRPGTTGEVAAVVGICAANGVAVVPQGGNTGLVGGGMPDASGTQVLLNLSRLNRIRDLDTLDDSVVVEAGCVLKTVQDAAAAADRLFALSLGSEGSAQIGGLIATNAGGTMTVRYGNMREQVLGLEVVLPDGRVWNGLRRLRKDNTGYDLRQMFVGAEGTLGIVTAAALRLLPRQPRVETAFCAVRDPEAAVALLAGLRAAAGEAVTAFELISRTAMTFALDHVPGTADPLDAPAPWYVLAELAGPAARADLADALERVLADALDRGEVTDGAMATSEARRAAFWQVRERITEGRRIAGSGINHDISVPTSRIPAFVRRCDADLAAMVPGIRIANFGHLADGNLHYNLNPPAGADPAPFLARKDALTALVHDRVLDFGGSISAEHGIGTLKRAELARLKDPLSLELMRRVKAAMDPAGIMNPGKVI